MKAVKNKSKKCYVFLKKNALVHLGLNIEEDKRYVNEF